MSNEEKINKIKEILLEKNGITENQEFGLHYGQVMYYLELIEEIINQ